MPYEPSLGTPMVTHSPFVPRNQSRMWSIAAEAAEAAELAPRASMTAAPRLPTVGRNVSRYHAWSTHSVAGLPSMVAKRISEYMEGAWLPQTQSFLIEQTGLPVLARAFTRSSWFCERKRFVRLPGVSQ